MEISMQKRMEIMRDIKAVVRGCEYEIPADPYDRLSEFAISAMAGRYRMLICIFMLHHHGIRPMVLNRSFLKMELFSELYRATMDEEYGELQFQVNGIIEPLADMNLRLLDWVTENTDWKNCSVSTLDETEFLTDEEILMFREPICILWGIYKDMCEGEDAETIGWCLPKDVIRRLTDLGLEPDSLFTYDECSDMDTLLLYNPKILGLWKLCQENESLRQDALYHEIGSLLSRISVLDRYFPGLDVYCSFEQGGFYVGHCMGSIYTDQLEFVGPHLLMPEMLVALLLADSAADEFLKKIGTGKECGPLAFAGKD